MGKRFQLHIMVIQPKHGLYMGLDQIVIVLKLSRKRERETTKKKANQSEILR